MFLTVQIFFFSWTSCEHEWVILRRLKCCGWSWKLSQNVHTVVLIPSLNFNPFQSWISKSWTQGFLKIVGPVFSLKLIKCVEPYFGLILISLNRFMSSFHVPNPKPKFLDFIYFKFTFKWRSRPAFSPVNVFFRWQPVAHHGAASFRTHHDERNSSSLKSTIPMCFLVYARMENKYPFQMQLRILFISLLFHGITPLSYHLC